MSAPIAEKVLHLALGDSAAGCLREACRAHGLTGEVVGIPDDLAHGPLGDGVARMEYLQACHHPGDDLRPGPADAFAPWGELAVRLDRERPGVMVIWAGRNVSEVTFTALACFRLAGRGERLEEVAVTSRSGPDFVAALGPGELAALFPSRRLLGEAERESLAGEFVRLRDESGILRRWEDGRVIGVPVDLYDSLLLGACHSAWRPASMVVGAAMGACDAANSLSDLFFGSRLRALVDSGKIEADGPRRILRDYRVRLAGN